MSAQTIRSGSLVLYKIRPAVVTDVGDKITIQIEPKKAKRVRDKDIELLHPGPVVDASRLQAEDVDVEEAWELLEGESCSLAELSELLFDEYTPETAWSSWVAVTDGVHFSGTPNDISTRSREDIDADLAEQQLKLQQEQEKQRFYDNISNASLTDADRKKLSEVEMLALGTTEKSQILRDLSVEQTPESAHAFLLRCGYWPETFNPYPKRVGVTQEQPQLAVAAVTDEQRLDLTAMPAYAIDDEGSEDPDDAISFQDDTLWVHIADVAALVEHDSELDIEARGRSANLYLPEAIIHMLPHQLTRELGMGLQEVSPALSVGMKVDGQANITDIQIAPSLVKVQRFTYEAANQKLDELFKDLQQVTDRFRQNRLDNNAAQINLPEGSIRVKDGEILIRPMVKFKSREMVADAMMMAGHAVARFCADNGIPIPYASQPEPDEIRQPQKMSEMFAYRRLFKASRIVEHPEPHFGLGLDVYTRCTSPLRRYQDLVVHQQLRAYLKGEGMLEQAALGEKLMGQGQQSAAVRRAERLSNLHWKLVFLKRQSNWQGDAVIVDIDERKATLVIPALAMETKIRTRDNFQLDDTISIRIADVNLPEQIAYFQYLQ